LPKHIIVTQNIFKRKRKNFIYNNISTEPVIDTVQQAPRRGVLMRLNYYFDLELR